MWLSLSQVQEWMLEFSCDMLYISIRTDVAWYRLTKCAPTCGAVGPGLHARQEAFL